MFESYETQQRSKSQKLEDHGLADKLARKRGGSAADLLDAPKRDGRPG